LIVSDGIIKVQESQIELNKVFLNRKPLENLSNKTNGTFQLWNNRNLVTEKINNTYRDDSYNRTLYFINTSWLLVLMIVVFLLEMVYRRRIGLI
jgi:hypothetical protein